MDDRYRALDFVQVPIHDGEALFYFPATRTARVMPGAVAGLLRGCTRFDSLEQHAARLLNGIGSNQQNGMLGRLVSDLRALADSGALISYSTLKMQLSATARRRSPPAAITTIGIPTRNRPELLERCLRSYVAHVTQSDRRCRWIVVDDSSTAAASAANRKLVADFNRERSDVIRYLGVGEQRRFVRALVARGGLPADVVQFALLNPEASVTRVGASRNLLLLQTAGEVTMQVDDDTVCEPKRAIDGRPGVAFSSQTDPTRFHFPDVAIDAQASNDATHMVALLDSHESLLARPISQCVSGQEPLLVEDVGGVFLRKYSPGSVVRVTQSGIRGDVGAGNASGYLFMDADSRSRMSVSQRRYAGAIRSRQVVRSVTRYTVSDTSLCMAMCLGLDNRTILPPFAPSGRNEDGVFGNLLRTCYRDGFMGFLPCTVLHLPSPPRFTRHSDLWRHGGKFRACDALCLLIASAPLGSSSDGATALLSMGKYLQSLGEMAPDDFRELVHLQQWRMLNAEAVRLRELLSDTGAVPSFWQRDADRYLRAIVKCVETPGVARDNELHRRPMNGEIKRLQALVKDFGRLLEYWPAMVQTARTLRSRDADGDLVE